MLLSCKGNDALSLNSTLIGSVDPEVLTLDSFRLSHKNTTEYLSLVFKLNLLLIERVFIPSGYFFDNPVFQELLKKQPALCNLLYSRCNDGETVLYVGVDSQNKDRIDCDEIFKNWLYGRDGARVNNPCAALFVGNRDFHNKLNSLNPIEEKYSLEQYFKNLYAGQYNFTTEIRCAIESATHVSYPEDRHKLYKNELIKYFSKLTVSEQKKSDDILRVIRFIEDSKKISRSQIKLKFARVWAEHVDQFISLRQKSYFSGDSGCLSPNTSILMVSNPRSYLEGLIASIFNSPDNHFQIVLSRLIFEDIRAIREENEYLKIMGELNSVISYEKDFNVDELVRFLKNHWAPSLFSVVRKINPNAIRYDDSRSAMLGAGLGVTLSASVGYVGSQLNLENEYVFALSLLAGVIGLLVSGENVTYHNSLSKFKNDIYKA